LSNIRCVGTWQIRFATTLNKTWKCLVMTNWDCHDKLRLSWQTGIVIIIIFGSIIFRFVWLRFFATWQIWCNVKNPTFCRKITTWQIWQRICRKMSLLRQISFATQLSKTNLICHVATNHNKTNLNMVNLKMFIMTMSVYHENTFSRFENLMFFFKFFFLKKGFQFWCFGWQILQDSSFYHLSCP